MINQICGWFVGVSMSVLCETTVLNAAEPGDADASAQRAPGADAESADVKKRAESMLNACAEAYRALTTYQDSFTIEYEAKSKDGDEALPGMETQTGTLKFARPNRIYLEAQQRVVASDGQKLWMKWSHFNQYTETDAPKVLGVEDVAQQHAFSFMSDHPALSLLLAQPGDSTDVFADFKNISAVVPEQRNGQPGHRISGEIEMDQLPVEAIMPCKIWLSDATHLIGEVRVDMKPYMDAMAEMMGKEENDGEEELNGEEEEEAIDDEDEPAAEDDEEDGMAFTMPKFEQLDVIITLSDIGMNQEIAPESFVFTPEPEDEKVEEFGFAGGMDGESAQDELIGKLAPEFSGLDLENQKIALADFRGRVVLLDFWATWCGPCVQAIPHVQKIADHFSDKPVTVLGINQDMPGSESRVKKFLEKKKITFRQVMPSEQKDESIGNKFAVTGIPCSVLIDQNGIVQDIHVGFSPDMVEELSEQIEKLLAGQSLFDPAELEAKAKTRDAELPEPDEPGQGGDDAADTALQEIAPARLRDESKIKSQVWGHQAQRIDVDGDGAPEVVCASMMGGIDIISADGQSVKKLKFKNFPQGSSLTAFRPVQLDGEMHWLIAAQRYSMMGAATAEVALHKSSGERVWSYKPKLPAKTNCTMIVDAADLDGDGRPECVVGLSTHRFKSTKRNQMQIPVSQKAFVVVLDASGAQLSQRRLGKTIEYVQALAANESSGGAILCISESRVRRFVYDPTASEQSNEVERDLARE